MTADRSTGELGRSVDALTAEFRAFRDDFARAMETLDERYPRKEVVDLQIHHLRRDVAGLQKGLTDRADFAANTRRMVYLALLSVILTPLSALLIRGH